MHKMKKKRPSKKAKKLTVTIALRDFEKLTQLAKMQRTSRPIVARRLIKSQLAEMAIEKQAKNAKNQLGLFDSLQIDIFNGTSKVES